VGLSGPGRRWVINAEHRLLLDAIARHDRTDAQHCVSAHIRRTRVELEKHPEIFSQAPG
jgi:DNA-binding GntR family transcriptional regulator